MQNYYKDVSSGRFKGYLDAIGGGGTNNGHSYFKMGDKSIMANDQFLAWMLDDRVYWNQQDNFTNFQAFKYESNNSLSTIVSTGFAEFTATQANNSPFLLTVQGYLGAGGGDDKSDAFFAASYRDDMVMIYHPEWKSSTTPLTPIPSKSEDFLGGGFRGDFSSAGTMRWGEPRSCFFIFSLFFLVFCIHSICKKRQKFLFSSTPS